VGLLDAKFKAAASCLRQDGIWMPRSTIFAPPAARWKRQPLVSRPHPSPCRTLCFNRRPPRTPTPRSYGILVLLIEIVSSTATIGYAVLLVKYSKSRRTKGLPIAKKGQQPDLDNLAFHVRVLVPCYKESVELVKITVLGAVKAPLPRNTLRTVYLCDDGKVGCRWGWLGAVGGSWGCCWDGAGAPAGRLSQFEEIDRAQQTRMRGDELRARRWCGRRSPANVRRVPRQVSSWQGPV
jgi:hypothetical protein